MRWFSDISCEHKFFGTETKNFPKNSRHKIHFFDVCVGVARGLIFKPKICTYLGKFCRDLQSKTFVTFYGDLVYFTAIWYSLWPFGILYGYLVYFFPFWYVVPKKIWQPWYIYVCVLISQNCIMHEGNRFYPWRKLLSVSIYRNCNFARKLSRFLFSSAGLPDGLFSNQKSQFG
jgi:hypothetical protein